MTRRRFDRDKAYGAVSRDKPFQLNTVSCRVRIDTYRSRGFLYQDAVVLNLIRRVILSFWVVSLALRLCRNEGTNYGALHRFQ